MDMDRARALLTAEREEVTSLLEEAEQAVEADRETETQSGPGDSADFTQPLEDEEMDSAIAERMRARLDAIDRALRRLDEGTYGLSVRSGKPIPDERLEADPAAELTVEEARAEEAEAR
jgi:DnaK suppressor protein